jgi:hypothetical protein
MIHGRVKAHNGTAQRSGLVGRRLLFDLICSHHLFVVLFPCGVASFAYGDLLFVRLVPIAILVWAIAGVAFGLIVDLPVFFRVCVLIAVAALPRVLLIRWHAASQKRRA